MNHSTKFIAEVSSNHHCDLERSIRFVDVAAEIGCDAVKFQMFRIDKLFAQEILSKSDEHRQRKKWELPEEFIPILSKHAHQKGLEFSCTPFYLEAVDKLLPYVDFYKIASYELLWSDLISKCAKTTKPLILSTGMATLNEVADAAILARNSGCTNLVLLHCVSGYPTPPDECNLSAIQTIRDVCECPVGWSDHSVSPGVLYRAIDRWGASVIEFHLDLDGEGEEFEPGHCWLPRQIEEVIRNIKTGVRADGNGLKTPAMSEVADRNWRADPADGLRPMKIVREEWDQKFV